MTDADPGDEDESGDELEEEGKDEAPPQLPAFEFNQEAMQPGQEYFQSENGLASLIRKMTEVMCPVMFSDV